MTNQEDLYEYEDEDDTDLQLYLPDKTFACPTRGCHGYRTVCRHGYVTVSCECGVSNDVCEKCEDEWWEEMVRDKEEMGIA